MIYLKYTPSLKQAIIFFSKDKFQRGILMYILTFWTLQWIPFWKQKLISKRKKHIKTESVISKVIFDFSFC